MSKNHIFINGNVFDPRTKSIEKLNVAIKNNTVIGLGYLPDDKDEDFTVHDIQDCLIIPNTMDGLNLGGEDALTTLINLAPKSGINHTVYGGPYSGLNTPERTDPFNERCTHLKTTAFYGLGALTKDFKNEELAEFSLMNQKAIVGFSDGSSINSEILMRNTLQYSQMVGKRLVIRPLNKVLSNDGQMNEGYYSTILGLKGIPSGAEDMRLARDIQLLDTYGGKLMVGPISTEGSVYLVRQAKERGLDIMACTAPHYLIFTEEDLDGYNTNLKVFPPLRTQQDKKALLDGLKEGVIDCIVSDHVAIGIDGKRTEFQEALPGIASQELFLPVLLSNLHVNEKIAMETILSAITANPAKAYGLKPKGIALTNKPSFTVVDVKNKRKVTPETVESNGINFPYMNHTLIGFPIITVQNGEIVYTA